MLQKKTNLKSIYLLPAHKKVKLKFLYPIKKIIRLAKNQKKSVSHNEKNQPLETGNRNYNDDRIGRQGHLK